MLVNNAGLASKASPEVLRPIGQLTLDEWRTEIDRNLTTAFLCSRAFGPVMAERGWGRIVNLTATAGPLHAMPTEGAYAAQSGGAGLTRALAMELAAGVTVNAVAPASIYTAASTVAELKQGSALRWPRATGRGRRSDRLPVLASRVVHNRQMIVRTGATASGKLPTVERTGQMISLRRSTR